MPACLQPTAPTAAAAILVGDPGRALLLAQVLLKKPKMSNHARGLWGYFGSTAAGSALTIQSTGIGGPSAALVLGDLDELGVKRAVRVGTCVGLSGGCKPGDLLVVGEAIAAGGSAAAVGVEPGTAVRPDRKLSERLLRELKQRTPSTIISVDADPAEASPRSGAVAADMQTASLLAKARSLRIEAATVLIVNECAAGAEPLEKEALGDLEKRAGESALSALSS